MNIQQLGRTTAIALVSAALLAGCNKPAAAGKAAPPAAAAAAPAAGTLGVQKQADLGQGFQALPRFTGGDADAARHINEAMAKLDAAGKESLTLCPDMPHAGQSQTVKVTRNGALLAIEVAYESDCGAYPSSGINSYVFDTATGGLLDWSKALPGAAIVNGDPDLDYYSNYFSSAPLQARVVAAARKETDAEWKADCVPVLEGEGLSFSARFNTETGALDVTPELPHVAQACGNSLSLTVDDLKALNADPRVIAAARKG